MPLAQGQIADLVAILREASGEIAIPALGTPDSVRKQAVVDDTNAHAASIPFRPSIPFALQRSSCGAPSIAALHRRSGSPDAAAGGCGVRRRPPRVVGGRGRGGAACSADRVLLPATAGLLHGH